MKIKRFFSFLFAFILIFTINVFAIEQEANFYVNDSQRLLSEEQKSEMISKAEKLSLENGVQVAVVITDKVVGNNPQVYATKIFNEMGIGSEKDNNGVLLFVATEDGKVNIVTGDSMEAYISDSKASDIIQTYFMPEAKNDNLAGGVFTTFNALIDEGYMLTTEGRDYSTSTEIVSNQNGNVQVTQKSSGMANIVFYFIIIMIVIVVMTRRGSRYTRTRRRDRYYGTTNYFFHNNRNHNDRGSDNHRSTGGGFFGGGSSGGGGRSSGGGAGSSFQNKNKRGGGGFGGGSSSGGGGRSSGGGAGGSFFSSNDSDNSFGGFSSNDSFFSSDDGGSSGGGGHSSGGGAGDSF